MRRFVDNNQLKQTEAIVCTIGAGINALSIIRSLGRAGVSVHVIACNPDKNLAVYSRYCTSTQYLDSINSDSFRDTILSLAHKCQGKPVLYVDNDKMLSAMLPIAVDLKDKILLTSIPEHVSALLDKKDQIASASAAGLTIPKSWFPANWDDIATIKSPSRLIAKSRFPVTTGKNTFKVLSAPDGKTLRDMLQMYSISPDELFIQEYIEGGDDDVYFALCYKPLHTEQTAVVTGKKLVQSGSGDGGVMVLGETEPNKTVHNLSLKMMRFLGYKGYFGIEFKYCTVEKKFFFIEVNSRAERFNALGRVAQLDLNIISHFDALGHDVRDYIENHSQTAGVWVDGHKLLLALCRRRKSKDFILFLKSLFRKKEWAVFTIDDPMPFYHFLMKNIRN